MPSGGSAASQPDLDRSEFQPTDPINVSMHYEAILDAGCDAWNRLIAEPETIMSIGMRDWAHTGQ